MIIKINGSIYPEKPFFDGFNNRTARLNKAFELIYKLGESYSENKNGQTEPNFDLSTSVNRIGLEPMTLPTCAEKIGIINRDALSN